MPISHGKQPIVLVESPRTSASLAAKLGALRLDYEVMATNGHLYDYQQDGNSYHLVNKQKQVIDELKSYKKRDIIIATDSDPQGELIALHIQQTAPDNTFHRCYFNDLTTTGVRTALNNMAKDAYQFDSRQAVKAALVKLINLRIKSEAQNRFYTTTTGIELCKQWDKHGRINDIDARTYEISGQHYHSIIPNHHRLSSVHDVTPVVTKDLIIQRALHEKTVTTMEELQESYQLGRLSYIRTTSNKLPMTSVAFIEDEILGDDDIAHYSFFSHDPYLPHYAIHNLSSPRSSIEKAVFIQNRTALTNSHRDIYAGKTDTGALVFLKKHHRKVSSNPSPANEISWLLAQSNNTSPSTIESSAHKYAQLYFNGQHRNEQLITKTIEITQKQYPSLWELGLNELVAQSLQKNVVPIPSPSEPLKTANKATEYAFDLKL